MKLEIKTGQEINLELAENLFQDKIITKLKNKSWVSEESLLELSPKELLDEVRKLHIQKFEQEKNKIKEL